MNNQIIFSPYAARLPNGSPSPKNYPYSKRLVELLSQSGYEVVQIGIAGEDRIDGVGQFIQNWPADKLVQLFRDARTWVSVDNGIPHFANYHRLKAGIVLFGPSDPKIFGYPQNTNILRGRDYLRQFQYDTWMAVEPNAQCFVYAENVMPEVFKLAPLPLSQQPASLARASLA